MDLSGLPDAHVSADAAKGELVDETGRVLPPELIHHFNLIDPSHRELFLPIAQRMAAAAGAGHHAGAHMHH